MALIRSFNSRFILIQSKSGFKSNFTVIQSLHIRIYIVVQMYIKGHVKTVDTKDQRNAIVYCVCYVVCWHCRYHQSMQCIEYYICWHCQHWCLWLLHNTVYRVMRCENCINSVNIDSIECIRDLCLVSTVSTYIVLIVWLKSPQSQLSQTFCGLKIGWILRKLWARMRGCVLYRQCWHR